MWQYLYEIWQYSAVFGSISYKLAVFGSISYKLAVFGSIFQYLAVFHTNWQYLAVYCLVSKPGNFFGVIFCAI